VSVHAATLQRAAEILGGPMALAEYLDEPAYLVEAWLEGRVAPPAEAFLRAVDVIVDFGLTEMRNAPPAPPAERLS
jgi:hypothetical protein